MADDDKIAKEGAFAQGFDPKLIEELYRLAEIVQSDTQNGDRERKRIAAERMAAILKATAETYPPQPQRSIEHRWILDVLLDLVHYAETYDLDDVGELLNETRFKTYQILNWK